MRISSFEIFFFFDLKCVLFWGIPNHISLPSSILFVFSSLSLLPATAPSACLLSCHPVNISVIPQREQLFSQRRVVPFCKYFTDLFHFLVAVKVRTVGCFVHYSVEKCFFTAKYKKPLVYCGCCLSLLLFTSVSGTILRKYYFFIVFKAVIKVFTFFSPFFSFAPPDHGMFWPWVLLLQVIGT